MAQTSELETGAPIPRDALDPDLIKLSRTRPTIGAVTCLGVIVMCVYFIVRLGADRQFADAPEQPVAVSVADVTAGKVASESHIALDGEPLMANAIRTSKAAGGLGYRITPMRGSGDRVWVALTDGDDQPTVGRYTGRLRPLDTMPFERAMRAYATANPRPVFATPTAVQAALRGGTVTTVTGETVTVPGATPVAFDVVEPAAAQLVVTFNAKLADLAAWKAALGAVGIVATPSATADVAQRDAVLRQARFDVQEPVATVTQKLQTAKLWASVEPVTRHVDLTWAALQAQPPGALAGVDLVGLYVLRGIPDDAQVLLVGETPQDYWHVLPITIALAVIALLFAWALVRAIRELLPTRA